MDELVFRVDTSEQQDRAEREGQFASSAERSSSNSGQTDVSLVTGELTISSWISLSQLQIG